MSGADVQTETGENTTTPSIDDLGTDPVEVFQTMTRIRTFELKLSALFKRGKLPGFVHLCAGEEATAAATCAELEPGDRVSSTHRGHGHLLAKGADPRRMMAEIYGRVDGYCKGMGGSMHIMDFSLGILGANGIVGAGIPLATGAALADSYLGRESVNVAFFGDGAANSGVFPEAMNLAAIWKLPVIYVCENNGYTEWMRSETITAGKLFERATPFGIPSRQIDGNDVLAIRAAVREAVDRARAGEGPTFIEMMTYRWLAHNEGEEAFSGPYRPKAEIEMWRTRDPISRYRDVLLATGAADGDELARIESAVHDEIEEAVAFAEASPFPDVSQATDFVFAPTTEGVA